MPVEANTAALAGPGRGLFGESPICMKPGRHTHFTCRLAGPALEAVDSLSCLVVTGKNIVTFSSICRSSYASHVCDDSYRYSASRLGKGVGRITSFRDIPARRG
jgi:hypothetical protein